MIDPIDLEAKYLRWLAACPAAVLVKHGIDATYDSRMD
tara:strand:- start:13217 stop:13330 length:114 start_codon:yes stop_codon:yes gene_type:complete